VTALNDDEAPSLVDQVVSSCQNAVAERAVAPSTVSFVSSELATTETGWTVSGQLDGQNVFGAMIRAPYACAVQYTLEGEQASLRVFVVE